MKKFFSISILLIAATFIGSAQSITVHLSGTVLRQGTNAPVFNHQVLISADGNPYNFTFNATRYTNQSGFYDCTISNVPDSLTPVTIIVRTKDCDSTYTVITFQATNSTATANFLLCNTNTGDCQAHFEHHADSTSPLHVHFLDTSTPPNTITSCLWNFGDPFSGNNNTATTGDPWHTFTNSGTYVVCLTIHTTTGCTSTWCDTIQVSPHNNNCENWMTYTINGLTVSFEGHDHSAFPTTYSWDFGDPASGAGNTSGLQNPVHTYPAVTAYTVTLHTSDSTGCEWTRTQVISLGNTSFDLYGHVYLMNNALMDHGIVELIRMESEVVASIDTVEVGDSIGFYHFAGVGQGHYYLRATLLPSSAYYGQYVPTYYHDAVVWANATMIELGQPANPYDIHMHHANGCNSGNGNINGTISNSGKYNGAGIPAPNVEVLLQDESGQTLSYAMTDGNGEFTFPEMALGTYKVYPEIVGKSTTPTTVVLDANHTGASLVFAITGGHISGMQDLANSASFIVSEVYPNPVTDAANVIIQTQHGSQLSVKIYSISGELTGGMNASLHQGSNKVTLPSSNLRKGMYYLKIEKPEGGFVVRKFITGR